MQTKVFVVGVDVGLNTTTSDNKLAPTPVHFKIDGLKRSVNAGGKVILTPGESICLEQVCIIGSTENLEKGKYS